MNAKIALLGLLIIQTSWISAAEAPANPAAGFQSIFDGTLKDWDGDPVYWKVENGTLIGEVRPETLLKRNSFIIWRGGELGGLRAETRIPRIRGRQQRHQLPQR